VLLGLLWHIIFGAALLNDLEGRLVSHLWQDHRLAGGRQIVARHVPTLSTNRSANTYSLYV
jgi:hypothetical protein